jgi:3-oxoacyl-[acyl-carrier-protein] synthase II
MQKKRRVVITGLGALTPIGNKVSEFWNSLINGVSGANLITKFDTSKFKTKFACELKNFDPNLFFDRKELRKYDPHNQYGIIAADEAIGDAALISDNLDKDRVGVIWSSGIGGLHTFQEMWSEFTSGDGIPHFNPYYIPKMISDMTAGHISIRYGFKGINFAIVSACASSANAIADAYAYIKLGKVDVVVCGGSEAAISEAGIGGFSGMHALSQRNEDYLTASRPFDKDRDGFVLGEGSGVLIVEDLEHATARGAKIYAEIVGTGFSADAHHLTAPHPDGFGAAMAMKMAIDESECELNEIDHINSHGTSTGLGDVAEIKAIQSLFGEQAYNININSTKSMTGHLLGAAGAIEAIASILAINNSIVPPTINHFTDDDEIDNKLNFTFNKAQKREIKLAISNNFGFGGHNVSIAFKKFEI